MYSRPSPRPGPVPITAPTLAASTPCGATNGSSSLVPRGTSSPRPIGRVALAAMVLTAKTRPWKRCGTLVWTMVVMIPLTSTRQNRSPKAPTATSAAFGRSPATSADRPISTVRTLIPTIRRRRGPPHTAMARPPPTAPAPPATRTAAVAGSDEKDRTSGPTITVSGMRNIPTAASRISRPRKALRPRTNRKPSAISAAIDSRRWPPIVAGNRTAAITATATR